MTRPRADHWQRCDKCGICYFIQFRINKAHDPIFVTSGCRVCWYNWWRKTVTDSIYKYLKNGFKSIKEKEISTWERSKDVFTRIYRNDDKIILKECYLEASKKFETGFNRIWERNLQ